MSLSVSAHCLDNPGVQEEKHQDWEDSWNNWWFIRNILRKKQSSDKVRGDLLHRSVGLVLFDFASTVRFERLERAHLLQRCW